MTVATPGCPARPVSRWDATRHMHLDATPGDLRTHGKPSGRLGRLYGITTAQLGGIMGIELYHPGPHQGSLPHHQDRARHRGLRAALVVLTAVGAFGLTILVAVALLAVFLPPVP